jgi:hypothetical protein
MKSACIIPRAQSCASDGAIPGVASTLSNWASRPPATIEQARSFFERSLALRQELGCGRHFCHWPQQPGDPGSMIRGNWSWPKHILGRAWQWPPFKIAHHNKPTPTWVWPRSSCEREVEAAHSAINASLEQAELGRHDLAGRDPSRPPETRHGQAAWAGASGQAIVNRPPCRRWATAAWRRRLAGVRRDWFCAVQPPWPTRQGRLRHLAATLALPG